MTAEEKLEELYKDQMPLGAPGEGNTILVHNGGVVLAASIVDLIANLVVERLKKGKKGGLTRNGLERELDKLVEERTKIVEEMGPKIVVSEPLSDNDFDRMRRHLDKEMAWLLKAKKEILGG